MKLDLPKEWYEHNIEPSGEGVTRVVNFRLEPCDVKITRTPKNEIPEPPLPGCFGNPFPLSKFSREDCVSLYRDYFLVRIKNDPAFKKAVLELKGKRLGCFCKQPDQEVACHGDVIKEWLDSLGDN